MRELQPLTESAYPIRVTRKLIGKNLDRDLTLQLRIARTVDFAHTPLPSSAVIS